MELLHSHHSDVWFAYALGFCIGLACGHLWGYRSAVIDLGGRLHP